MNAEQLIHQMRCLLEENDYTIVIQTGSAAIIPENAQPGESVAMDMFNRFYRGRMKAGDPLGAMFVSVANVSREGSVVNVAYMRKTCMLPADVEQYFKAIGTNPIKASVPAFGMLGNHLGYSTEVYFVEAVPGELDAAASWFSRHVAKSEELP